MKTVERGAALLDERKPGWDRKVDLEKLDLYSPCNCVLGQVYGDRLSHYDGYGYNRGLRLLELHYQGSKLHGFTAMPNGYHGNLTAAWRRLIEKRRGAG